jgi:outer membrane protein
MYLDEAVEANITTNNFLAHSVVFAMIRVPTFRLNMLKVRMILVSVVMILLAIVSASGQPLSLTIEDAVSRAIETSRLLKASRARVSQSEAKIEEANIGSLPTFTLTGGYNRLSNVPAFTFDNASTITGLLTLLNALPGSSLQGQFSETYINNAGAVVRQQSANSAPTFPIILDQIQFQLNAQQVLYAGGRIDASKEIAKYTTEASRFDVENDKLSIAFAVRQAYWAMYKAQELRKSLDESAKQLSARIVDAKNMNKAGMLTSNDVLKLQVSLSNINVQILDIDNQIRSGMIAMNNLIGVPLTTELQLATNPQNVPKNAEQQSELVSYAISRRPDILANEKRISAAQSAINLSEASWYPTVALAGNVLYANPNQRVFPVRSQFDATWAVGINFSWNIWNWNLTRYQTDESKAQLIQIEESTKALQDNIKVEVMQNYMSLQPAKERIKVSNESVQQAEDNYSIISNKLKAGTATSTDVLEAQSLLLQSKINTISATVDYEIAQVKLMKSLGK